MKLLTLFTFEMDLLFLFKIYEQGSMNCQQSASIEAKKASVLAKTMLKNYLQLQNKKPLRNMCD